MARSKAVLPIGARLADYLTLGFLALDCPLEKARQALVSHDVRRAGGSVACRAKG
ncbi:MAG: hypothetical protein LBF93_10110 [Zoogloeaceae bacterium]|jgi:hypothetical protein|nr:hypothetical protein [Zoogloeaceae bacterium]